MQELTCSRFHRKPLADKEILTPHHLLSPLDHTPSQSSEQNPAILTPSVLHWCSNNREQNFTVWSPPTPTISYKPQCKIMFHVPIRELAGMLWAQKWGYYSPPEHQRWSTSLPRALDMLRRNINSFLTSAFFWMEGRLLKGVHRQGIPSARGVQEAQWLKCSDCVSVPGNAGNLIYKKHFSCVNANF